jgi:hypothetical protein
VSTTSSSTAATTIFSIVLCFQLFIIIFAFDIENAANKMLPKSRTSNDDDGDDGDLMESDDVVNAAAAAAISALQEEISNDDEKYNDKNAKDLRPHPSPVFVHHEVRPAFFPW